MSRKIGILLTAFLILSLFITVIGCSSATTTPATTSTPATTTTTQPPTSTSGPQYGGTLRIITQPGVSNLGYPGQTYLPGETTLPRPAVESLCNFDPMGSGAVVPQLAADWKWAPDYKSITITLRKDVNFQDGTVCDAEAVKWNLDLYRTGWRPELKGVASVDVIDPYTVRLNTPDGYDNKIPQGLCSLCGMIVSPTAVQKLGDDALLDPVGTGAFTFASYDTDVSLTFNKWDGYWQKGLPYVDAIQWVFIKDPMTQLISFQAGEADVLVSVPISSLADLQASGKYNLLPYPTAAMGFAGDSNHPDSPFHDIKVRQAIAYAIDNAAIAKAVGFGFYKPINQLLDPTGTFYNEDIVGYPYNVEKAKKLLTEAGYPDGFDTKITFDGTDPTQVSMFSAIQGYLAEVGIKAELDAADRARLQTLQKDGWHNQMVYHWAPIARSIPPGTTNSHMYKGSSAYDWNSMWLPDEMNALYEKATAETDYAKSLALWQEFQKMAIDTYCVTIPVMAPLGYLATTKNVHDLDLRVYAMGEWLPPLVWLSK